MDKIKVVDCRDFCRECDEICILLSDYEEIDCEKYESQLSELIRSKGFSFDESKHEYWELD